jgi:tRNA (guanine37-N1)-methyltransferase
MYILPRFTAKNFHKFQKLMVATMPQVINGKSLLLSPPEEVKGMTELDREKFRKTVSFPSITIPKKLIGKVVGLKAIKNATIDKLNKIKPISDGKLPDEKLILFNPTAINDNLKTEICDTINNVVGIKPEFGSTDLELTYDNWDVKRCIKAVLPDDLEFSGYSQVGHIAHLNLREELLPYKKVLGEILLDKVSWAKTVVNKTDSIATEFRSFDMELLAGKDEFVTTMSEQGLTYKLDFKKVFWNSRLGTEHGRIVQKLDSNSVVFDIFAGVGPFALPAAKKGVLKIFANDKNPNSTFYMEENVKLNHIKKESIEIFTLDATDFITQIIGPNLISYASTSTKPISFHSIMNLPAIAVEFIYNFRGLLSSSEITFEKLKSHKFIIHCHMFVKANADVPQQWYSNEAIRLIREKLKLWHLEMDEVYNVRKVAGRKEMYCVTFTLPWEYLLESYSK